MSDNPLSTENANSLISRAKGILTTPAQEWPKIAAEAKCPKEVLLQYALPLMLIAPICSILGSFLSSYSLGLSYTLALTIVTFLLSIGMLYALAFLSNFLSQQFAGKNDFPAAFKLVAYSWTPVWLAGVLGLVAGFAPGLAILVYVALAYGFYLFYLGATPLMAIPADKAIGFVTIYVVAAIVLYIVLTSVALSIVLSVMPTPSPALIIYS